MTPQRCDTYIAAMSFLADIVDGKYEVDAAAKERAETILKERPREVVQPAPKPIPPSVLAETAAAEVE